MAPAERYLAYLTDIERSPNTIKAYAHDLKDWFVFLAGRGLDWRAVTLRWDDGIWWLDFKKNYTRPFFTPYPFGIFAY